MTEWGKFTRENFDKLILVLLFMFSAAMVVYFTQHDKDQDLILWGREICGTILGALLGLITGHALANARNVVTTTANPAEVTTTTETK